MSSAIFSRYFQPLPQIGAALLLLFSCPIESFSQDSSGEVRIVKNVSFVEFTVEGKTYRIERNNDQENRIEDSFAKTSRACPPFCVHPMEVADGIDTLGELEVLDFLQNRVAPGAGLLIDARLPVWFEKGTIPGSVNIPFNVFAGDQNPYRDQILMALGAERTPLGRLAFSNAKELALFCNGPWCDQSPRAIWSLIDAGYPREKIKYYRGGMQNWLMLGLTTIPGGSPELDAVENQQ
ncbi:MAG: rhodanese-like domain-containing protein [Rhodobacteraceae bacterium]|nr:rhodanese-like domain-containing protein [Paracoccaceae bacterium]